MMFLCDPDVYISRRESFRVYVPAAGEASLFSNGLAAEGVGDPPNICGRSPEGDVGDPPRAEAGVAGL